MLKTDLPARKKFVYDAHPCGILLCVRTSSTSPHDSLPGGDAHPREEQCFVWLDNFRAGATAALEHVARYGFPRAGATFLPYSSKAAWAHRHPHAFPHVHCDRLGRVTGFPHWSPRARSALDIPPEVVHLAALPGTTEALAGYEARAAAAGGRFPGGRLRASLGGDKRGGPLGGRLSRAAVLGNAERHQLHLEIYNYFQWLADEVGAARLGLAAPGSPDASPPLRLKRLLTSFPFSGRRTGDRRGRAAGRQEGGPAAARAEGPSHQDGDHLQER